MPLASSPTHSYIIRLKPGQDVTAEIEALTRTHHSQAASIVSVVGSLTRVALRFAGSTDHLLAFTDRWANKRKPHGTHLRSPYTHACYRR